MPIYRQGQEINRLFRSGTAQQVWNAGNRIFPEAIIVDRDFTLADAGISFSVSESGLVSVSLLLGAFEDLSIATFTNIVNGSTIDEVIVDTERVLNGFVRVPTDAMWTNSGERIAIAGTTTIQDAVDQMSAWTNTAQGEVMGGTEQPEMCGMFGAWRGAIGTTDLEFDAGGIPESAICASAEELCTIVRDRICTTDFTGATREDTYTCEITQQGEGTSGCAAISSLGLPTGMLGDMETSTVTGLTRQVQRMDTETRQVRNRDFTPATSEFVLGDLQITANNTNIPAGGANAGDNLNPFVTIGANEASVTSVTFRIAVTRNSNTNERTITVRGRIIGTVPAGFTDPGTDYDFQFDVIKMQDGTPIQDATALVLDPIEEVLPDPTQAVIGVVDVESVLPVQGRWNVSTRGPNTTITGATGTGNGSFTYNYDGGGFGGQTEIRIEVRSGHARGRGNLLATFIIGL